MAADNYANALARVLVHEGGYVDHPADPGGATMRGVTQAVYDGYRTRKGLPRKHVRQISDDELQAIYRTGYADKIAFDKLPRGVDYVVLDGAVNSGPSQSVKWLQRALRMSVVDGILGEATLAAVGAHNAPEALINDICDIRLRFLRALKTWPTFGRGWSHRITDVRAAATRMVRGLSQYEPVAPTPGGEKRAPVSDAKPRPAKGAADVATGGGIATTTAGGALAQAKDALTPLADSSDWIAKVVAVLVIAGVVMTIGGLAWRFYQSRKAAKQAEALDLPQAVAS